MSILMTIESARKRDQISAYRGRSKARATAIRRHPLEGRSHLISGGDCDFADQVGAGRQKTDLVTKCRNAL